jgi:pimeloyl-ACP methyl ester carboxylesterase
MSYLILFPGLGANEKLFERYDFGGRKTFVVKFLVPKKKETIQQYCERLATTIPRDEELIFIGVSFGGILAQEVSKIISAKKIILISSIKGGHEKPRYFSWLKIFPLYKIIPPSILKKVVLIFGEFFTPKSKEEQQLFLLLVQEADTSVIRWGIHQTLHWKQYEIQGNIFHIHGVKDRLFPAKKIKADVLIQDGSHFMIIQQRVEINALINRFLKTVQ